MNNREESGGKMRTKEHAAKHQKMKDPRKGFDYRKDIVTTHLYCVCRDCLKYCNYRKPVQCIDPFLMDMKNTYWIYHGLVTASKTERAICITIPEKTDTKSEVKEENATEN